MQQALRKGSRILRLLIHVFTGPLIAASGKIDPKEIQRKRKHRFNVQSPNLTLSEKSRNWDFDK